MSQVPVS